MDAPPFDLRITRRLRRWLPMFRRLSDSRDCSVQCVHLEGIIARCDRCWPTDAAFFDAWDSLHRSLPRRTTFNSSLWQQAGLSCGTLRLITAWRGSAFLGVLPMELSPRGFLEAPAHAISDYLEPLIDPADEQAIWSAILALLRKGWDRGIRSATLRNLPADAPCRELLESLGPRHGFACTHTRTGHALRIRLPDTWEAYLRSLGGHQRKELRRKLNKAQTQGDARLVQYNADNAAQTPMGELLDMIAAGDAFKREWFGVHVRPILERIGPDLLRRGLMRWQVLELEGTVAACLIEFPSPRGPMLYNTGYDPNLRQWSPGVVAFGLAIQQAIQEGAPCFDLLRGGARYKQELGAVAEPIYNLTLIR